jgi:hypothetical protein
MHTSISATTTPIPAVLLFPAPNALQVFATAHRVNAKRDDCNEAIIPGTAGHVYDQGEGRFGVLLIFESKRQWTNSKRKLSAAGFTIRQDGDTEGTAIFDPADRKQCRLALRIAGVKRQRVLTDEQRQAAAARLATYRAVRNAGPQ